MRSCTQISPETHVDESNEMRLLITRSFTLKPFATNTQVLKQDWRYLGAVFFLENEEHLVVNSEMTFAMSVITEQGATPRPPLRHKHLCLDVLSTYCS